jgi:hypothetical protein
VSLAVPVDEPTAGVSFALPADDALDEPDGVADVLAFGLDFALADDDGLFLGLDEDLAAAVDTWPLVGAKLVQLGLAAGWTLFLADPLELGLAPVLALEDVEGVAVAEPPGLALGVSLPLGLALGLPDAPEPALAVLPLLVLPLEDVAGAVVVAVVPLGELVLADGAQELGGGGTTTAGLLDSGPPAEGVGEIVPWPSVVGDGPPEELLMLRAEPMASLTWTTPWRAAGTTDKTTPTANTAAPTAKAGRSMASRQSLGRRGSRRCGTCRCGTRKPRRRISLAAAPERPSQTPRIQLGWLAWAGRDRILSRIRSRPSEPGST